MDLNDYIPALKYGATIPTDANDISLTSGYILVGNSSGNATGVAMSGDTTVSTAGVISGSQGLPFVATAAFGSVSIASGVTVLADSAVTQSRKVYLTNFCVHVAGVSYTDGSGTEVKIQDSTGTAFWTIKVGALTKDCELRPGSGSVTSGSTFLYGTGGLTSKGIQFKMASGTVASGNTGYVTVMGFIK